MGWDEVCHAFCDEPGCTEWAEAQWWTTPDGWTGKDDAEGIRCPAHSKKVN